MPGNSRAINCILLDGRRVQLLRSLFATSQPGRHWTNETTGCSRFARRCSGNGPSAGDWTCRCLDLHPDKPVLRSDGEVAGSRGRRERILLDIATVTRETQGEKGIRGSLEISARVAERELPLLYSLRLPARAAALDESGLIAADLDDCCTFHRAYHDAATRERLFESTVPIASLALEGPRFKRRVAAFVARMDGNKDHGAWGENAVGLISYATADRVIQQALVVADDPTVARRLRSLDDERTGLAWVDARTGAPILAVPGHGEVQPQLRVHFSTSGIEVNIPLEKDELVLKEAPQDLH